MPCVFANFRLMSFDSFDSFDFPQGFHFGWVDVDDEGDAEKDEEKTLCVRRRVDVDKDEDEEKYEEETLCALLMLMKRRQRRRRRIRCAFC